MTQVVDRSRWNMSIGALMPGTQGKNLVTRTTTKCEPEGESETARKTRLREEAALQEKADLAQGIWISPISTTSKDARQELPCKGISQARARRGFGISNLSIQAGEKELLSKPLPLRNKPVFRPRTPEMVGKDPLGTLNNPWEFFNKSIILTVEKNGEWVRKRRQELRVPKAEEWTVSNKELWDEMCLWIKVNANDIRIAREHAERGPGKKHQPHHPKARIFVIAEEDHVQSMVGNIYDLRQWKPGDKVTAMQTSTTATDWNADQLRVDAEASKCPDLETVQGLEGRGMWRAFSGSYASVLTPNGKGFFKHLNLAQSTTREEIEKGWIDAPTMHPGTLPIKMHSRNVAVQCRSFR